MKAIVKCLGWKSEKVSPYSLLHRDYVITGILGWKSDKVSPHSLRYGGATMLAAAGLPQYGIEYFGGWAAGSKSLKVYAQLGSAAVFKCI